jgi:hypothetical protein
MTAVLVIIALFFVIGVGVGVIAVIALSILRRDVGPPTTRQVPVRQVRADRLRTGTGMTHRTASPEAPGRTPAGSPTDANSGRRAGA